MKDHHLYILHLFDNTDNEKVNQVSRVRLANLMIELAGQGITEYTLVPGEYDAKNPKRAIQRGHKKIIQIAKDLGLSSVNIMEDDCVFTAHDSWQYFLSQIPSDYSLFTALIYSGDVDESGRIKNGMSGTHTLYNLHKSMFDFMLEQPDDVHCDRHTGQYAHQFKYYTCVPNCVLQRGGYSIQKKSHQNYDGYLQGKKLYGVD